MDIFHQKEKKKLQLSNLAAKQSFTHLNYKISTSYSKSFSEKKNEK